MERRIRNRWLNAFALGCLAVILLPAVNNPTPAKAVNPTTYSIDEANSLWVVVNKQRPLKPLRYEPKDLVVPKFGTALNSNPYGRQVRADVAKAAIDLARAMNAAGQGKLVIQSGYRPFAEQKSIHARQVKGRVARSECALVKPKQVYGSKQMPISMALLQGIQSMRPSIPATNTNLGTLGT
jgi:hypothetical protein